MPVDLTTASVLARQTLVLDDQNLVVLESQTSSSRMRRIPYGQVKGLAVSRGFPVVRMMMIALFILLPGVLLMLTHVRTVTIIGTLLIAIALVILISYLVVGKTTITIDFGTRHRTFHIIARAAKINRFLKRFDKAVSTSQETLRQKYAQQHQETPGVTIAPEPAGIELEEPEEPEEPDGQPPDFPSRQY